MIKFIQELKAKSPQHVPSEGKKNVVDLLVKRMAKYYPERSHHQVHASDVTKKGFCSRQYLLMDAIGFKRPDRYLDAALRATFDMGNDVSDRLRNDWLGADAVGHWHCGTCGTTKSFTTKPGPGCKSLQNCSWKYEEVNFLHEQSQISGSIDMMLNLGGTKQTIHEIKIIKPEDFAALKAPLGEHRIRTRLYLRLIAESNSPWKAWIDHEHAKILYVSRGYGKKNEDLGKILPFREFDIQRDDESVQPYIDLGVEVATARAQKVIPIKKVCESVSCTTAKGCPVKTPCFSGTHE